MQLVTSKRETSARGSLDSFSKQTIVECIKSGRYDYVSVALTPWHARMAVGSYLKLRAANLVDKGILLIDRHSKDGYLISPETRRLRQAWILPILSVAMTVLSL